MPFWIIPAFVAGAFLIVLAIEHLRPLRASREQKLRRVARNLAVAGIGFAVVELLQAPLLIPVSEWTMRRGLGLLNLAGASGWLRLAAALLLLDYTLWSWHWANHRVALLWRFHSVHHVDRDLDVSTGLRFHFGELGLSVGFRALQVLAIGADPLSVWVYQILLFGSVLFHHSNMRLPIRLERVLVRLVVTPRMHGIHHSDFRNETDSNWSSLLSAWDYLHGTVLLDVPQQAIEIGVPAYRDPKTVTLGRILALPFVRRRNDWTGANGCQTERPHGPVPNRLAD
jgi:sterol desaturase/sphingolipid hydroxylase (fatty acid hydroxylase superfamily)